MVSASVQSLYVSDDVALFDWTCAGDDRAIVPEMKRQFEIVFVRRGVFVAECQGEELPLTPNEVWLHPPGVPYRVRHPHGGDECTVLWASEDLLGDYADPSRFAGHARASQRAYQLQHAVWSAAKRGDAAPLEIEELTRGILEEVFSHGSPNAASDTHRRLVRRTKEVLAARYSENLSLAEVSREAGASPYHLSRVFRAVTGETINRYRSALRLRASLCRLADGEGDLTGLALDLGYCDHSHFTNAFRRAFGRPPSRFRELEASSLRRDQAPGA